MNDEGKVFVYGSLKVGGFFSQRFDKFRLDVKNAQTKGLLYDLGGFPALVLPGKKIVHGELHIYLAFKTVIKEMDIIEGYREGEDNNLYRRILTRVKTEDDEIVDAIVYTLADKYILELIKKGHIAEVENGIW